MVSASLSSRVGPLRYFYGDEIDRDVDTTERVLLGGADCEPGVAQRGYDFLGHDQVTRPGNFDGACDEVDE